MKILFAFIYSASRNFLAMVKVTPNIKLSSIPTASNYKKQDTVDEDETCGCRLYLCGSEKLWDSKN